MSELFFGFWLRFLQCGLEASLTLLVGVFTAAVFRRMVGPAGTRKLFGNGPKGLVRGWLAGMLLPVCSLGVIPVARELRRAGVPGGTVLAFVLAAPLLNPISFLYGLTLAEPVVILTFAAASLVLSTLAGFLWDRVFARRSDESESARLAELADAEPLPAYGPRRLLAVLVSAVKDLTGRDLLFYAVGLAGSAALAAAIPFGAPAVHAAADPFSPLLMAAVGIPIFTSPLSGMMKIGMMFGHGNSIGAAFVLFARGIGTSVGTVAWLIADFGRRRVLPWLAVYFAVVVGMAYVAQPLLTDPTKKAEDHSHAFDDYSCPFQAGSTGDLAAVFGNKLAEKFGPMERPPVYALGGLMVLGLLLRRRDRDMPDEALATGTPEVFDTDQGVQFTAAGWTGRVESADARVSMDGRGRCLDNVFVERRRRSVKYEDVSLRGYESVPEVERGLRAYSRFHNDERLHP